MAQQNRHFGRICAAFVLMTLVLLIRDVNAATTPQIIWANPPDIIFGTRLSTDQLNAIAVVPQTQTVVPGTFTYSPAAGTVLSVGNGRILNTTFSPTDTVNFTPATAQVTINVLPAPINDQSINYAVELSAAVSSNPAQITLNWTTDVNATSYTVSRKAFSDTAWPAGTALPASATSFVDTNVADGNTYEYRVVKTAVEAASGYPYTGYGFIFVGIDRPLMEFRGKIILIVDNTFSTSLSVELTRLQDDLIGDGWMIIRHDVSRTAAVTSVKSLIAADYNADPANVRSVLLFGHIPVPYSGDLAPDGHPDHMGAWPADVYYANIAGIWTDTTVNDISASRTANQNIPGDGKFDQSVIPSDLELQIGRIDLNAMAAFSLSETGLLQQYLNKDHNFRHKIFNLQRSGLVFDNFVGLRDEPASVGWRSFSALLGAANTTAGNYFPTLAAQGDLCSYGCGPGSYTSASGVGQTSDFAANDPQTVFTVLFGSYFADWDNQNNFLRAPLCTKSYTLTCCWAGRPWWYFHHMGLGETIGYSTRLSQNNDGTLYPGSNDPYENHTRQVHMALMGDPTLRLHPVSPVSNLVATLSASGATLTWNASPDTILGYNVYRAPAHAGPYTRLNSSLLTSTTYSDSLSTTGTYSYMVRAVKLENSTSGTYFNASQGILTDVAFSSPGNQPPVVTLTNPTDGATFAGPANITLTATASDPDDAVLKVDFFAGTTPIATVSSPPYTFAWNNVVAGSYPIHAVATDIGGLTSNSNIANITVTGPGPLPPPWLDTDIGSVGIAGSALYSNGNFTVMGSGVDIWNTADSFNFVYQPLNSNGQITARVLSVQNTNSWAKAGVMIRQNLTPGSVHALMVVTPGNGISFQRRTTANATSVSTSGAFVTAPYWVRLVRTGTSVTAFQSADGSNWVQVGSDTIPFSGQIFVGLALTAHNNTVLNTSTFSNVTITAGDIPPTVAITSPSNNASFSTPANITINATASDPDGTIVRVDFFANSQLIGSATTPVNGVYSFPWNNVAANSYALTAVATDNSGSTATSSAVNITVSTSGGGGLPAPWTDQDIGSVGIKGGATFDSTAAAFTVQGSGSDIWNSSDAFHFVYQPMNSDGQIIARVDMVQNTNSWAKAGVMIRQNTTAGSIHAFMCVTPGNGVSFQRRTNANSGSASTSGANVTAPYWVRLVRTGTTITASQSVDGATWVQVGSTTLALSGSALIGLAVCAHNNNALNTSAFSHVSVSFGDIPPSVALTSPANNASFTAPANITLNATATDADGTVVRVDFYNGTTLIGSSTTQSNNVFTFTWMNVAAGTYAFTAVATDNQGATSTSSVVNVAVTTSGGGGLPSPWADQDIGSVGIAGSASFTQGMTGTFTLKASGTDIWGGVDSCHFVYQQKAGNFQIIARVASIQNTNIWAKAGVMIRQNLNAGSPNAFMAVTPASGVVFQQRPTQNAITTSTRGASATAPYWVRLVRNGNTITGYQSVDGVNWVQVGSASISLTDQVYVGMALSAHNNTVLNTSTFDNVSDGI